MFRLKRLYAFILKSFIPLFLMTFFICLFIVVMQFVWRYVDEMVGKGFSFKVLGEFLFYAALSLVPMALPLAVLLSSLMTFGNFGERFELTAMKAAGINLLRIMRPLIILVTMISIGAFYFQNYMMPKVQVELWSLVFSMRQKSPEVDIPEHVFYTQINGINLYVAKKNPKTGMLYDVMLYNFSQGFENASVIVADSGRLLMSRSKQHLQFILYHGEGFENLQKQLANRNNVPYRREVFVEKRILIEFDTNFSRMDASIFEGQYISKNTEELNLSIDSMRRLTDSTRVINMRELKAYRFMDRTAMFNQIETPSSSDNLNTRAFGVINPDSMFYAMEREKMERVLENAGRKGRNVKENFEFKGIIQKDQETVLHRHEIEWHTKFTLSFACFIFLFIGAPLGAIIKKGGVGVPIILSVALFIFYYIINNVGYKMARDGLWPAEIGMWFSSFILLPMGVFLTYKASTDSPIMNTDIYVQFIQGLLGKRGKREINDSGISFRIVDKSSLLASIKELDRECDLTLNKLRDKKYKLSDYQKAQYADYILPELKSNMEEMISMLSDLKDKRITSLLLEYPILPEQAPLIVEYIERKLSRRWVKQILSPLLYLQYIQRQKRLRLSIKQTVTISERISAILKPPLKHGNE